METFHVKWRQSPQASTQQQPPVFYKLSVSYESQNGILYESRLPREQVCVAFCLFNWETSKEIIILVLKGKTVQFLVELKGQHYTKLNPSAKTLKKWTRMPAVEWMDVQLKKLVSSACCRIFLLWYFYGKFHVQSIQRPKILKFGTNGINQALQYW